MPYGEVGGQQVECRTSMVGSASQMPMSLSTASHSTFCPKWQKVHCVMLKKSPHQLHLSCLQALHKPKTSNNRPINYPGPNQQQPPQQRIPSQQLTLTQERRARRYQKTSIVQETNERQQKEINQLKATPVEYEARLAVTEARLNEQ